METNDLINSINDEANANTLASVATIKSVMPGNSSQSATLAMWQGCEAYRIQVDVTPVPGHDSLACAIVEYNNEGVIAQLRDVVRGGLRYVLLTNHVVVHIEPSKYQEVDEVVAVSLSFPNENEQVAEVRS